MKIKQIFNNNVVLTTSGASEIVVMGRGIGFQKKKGDKIDKELIEKEFVLTENVAKSIFPDVYDQLSAHEIDVVMELIDYAEKELNVEFQSNIYIALADHIQYSLRRADQVLPLANPLSYEVKKYYPDAYEVGQYALKLIEKRLDKKMHEDEAASLALHFVTGQKEGYLISQTIKVTRIVHEILNIVRLHFGMEFDEDSIQYARFLTHVQYFAHRIIFGEHEEDTDSFLFEQIQRSYPDTFSCVLKVKKFVEAEYAFEMGEDEQVYLTIHIERLVSENIKEKKESEEKSEK